MPRYGDGYVIESISWLAALFARFSKQNRTEHESREDKPGAEQYEQRCARSVGVHEGKDNERDAHRNPQGQPPYACHGRVTLAAAPLDPHLAEYQRPPMIRRTSPLASPAPKATAVTNSHSFSPRPRPTRPTHGRSYLASRRNALSRPDALTFSATSRTLTAAWADTTPAGAARVRQDRAKAARQSRRLQDVLLSG